MARVNKLQREIRTYDRYNYGTRLYKSGYAVIPTEFDVVKLRTEMYETMMGFPEFKTKPPALVSKKNGDIQVDRSKEEWVRGGFAQLNNPAAFHNPFIRRVRQWAMALIIPVLNQYRKAAGLKEDDWNLENLFETMMFRIAGKKATAESWHRDESPNMKSDDIMFGGWVNLDDTKQYLSGIPETHRVKRNKTSKGFNTFNREESVKLSKSLNRKKVPIDSGSIVIFNEEMIHEVMSKAAKHDSYRIFLAWRITRDTLPLIPNIIDLLNDQGVIPKKSGQIPPMYPTLNWVNSRPQLIRWSTENMKNETRETRIVGSGIQKGDECDVVHREMKSLKFYKFPMYKPYTKDEKKMVIPGKQFKLLVPGKKKLYRTYTFRYK